MSEFLLALALTHFLGSSAFAARAKPSCNTREIAGQDCRLSVGTYQIRLLPGTVARDDGTWHTVDPMPLKGEGITWEKVTFEIQHGLPLLQLWIWDAGQGEAKVQSLHWYTADARKGALKILAEGVVRRRRLKPVEEGLEKKKPAFLYDGWEKHSARILKNGLVDWQLGSAHRILDPSAPAPATHDQEKEEGH